MHRFTACVTKIIVESIECYINALLTGSTVKLYLPTHLINLNQLSGTNLFLKSCPISPPMLNQIIIQNVTHATKASCIQLGN
jgi:hypothetical protein